MYYSSNNNVTPNLIETDTKYYLNRTLHETHLNKVTLYNYIFNIGILIVFCLVVGGILMYKYKGKPTEYEKYVKQQQKKAYVLTTIQNFQKNKLKAQQQLLTNLPVWEKEF